MSESALLCMLGKLLSGSYDPVAAIVENETDRGFRVVRPGDAPWFPAGDWKPASVASIDGDTARLVLIDAIRPGTGALTLCLALIAKHGLSPAIIDPTAELAATLTRRGWEGRRTGATFDTRETVWRPRGKRMIRHV